MKPIKIYRDIIGLSELLKISNNYLVKATDGKSLVVAQAGKVIIEKGDPLKGEKELVIALYRPSRKIKIKNTEYIVNKIDSRISENIMMDISEIRKVRKDVIIEAFSRRAKKVVMVYKGGNLAYLDGNYKKLINEKKAIIDVYEIIGEEISEREVKQIPEEYRKVLQNTMNGK